MLVSVVIPTYNYGRFVTEAVQSALDQTHPNVEVIVVDDGSTDDTRERVAVYGDRVQYVYQPNQGLSAARNTGMRVARGELIALLDSDDSFHPRKLEHQVRYLASHPDVGLVGTWSWSDPARLLPEQSSPVGRRISLDDIIIKTPFCPSSVLMTRRCADAVGMFDPAVSAAADRDYWIRAAAVSGVAILDEELTFYRLHPESMSRKVDLMLGDERRVVEKALAMPEMAGRLFFRRKVWAYFNYTAGYARLQAGESGRAVRHLIRSLIGYPFPYSRHEVRYPFGRVRLMVTAFIGNGGGKSE